jgi:hypothetical protein
MKLALPLEVESGKGQITEIVAMLTSLAKSVAGDRIKEVPASTPTST